MPKMVWDVRNIVQVEMDKNAATTAVGWYTAKARNTVSLTK